MSLYYIEIFNDHFEYISSYQLQNVEGYEYDYISYSKSKLEIPEITASKGDYVRITSKDLNIVGIVNGCTDMGFYYELEFTPFLEKLDVNVHYNRSLLSSQSLEQWIAGIITDTFVSNPDSEQNIYGFEVKYSSKTYNALMDLEENIGNLYEILQKALINYNVVVTFSIDVQKKKITADVSVLSQGVFYIESDLPNILDKEFNFKKSDSSYNKMTVYNELNEAEYETFYLQTDGAITNTPAVSKRVTPVIFTNIFIKHENDDKETFHDSAYDKAFNKLSAEKYDNLIEIECEINDWLIDPLNLSIGQDTVIIRDGVSYSTMLTGFAIKDTVKLMFGTVRLELTKKLNRRLKS